ncbi:MAG: ImmA/IrrE family metallo-endopeptidase [Desulfobacterales bacterium]|nr:ImmA/IrrE family metallo-endopeptidase [Desulfobacterales bacterium]
MDTFSDKNLERIQSAACDLRIKHRAMEWEISAEKLIGLEGLSYKECDLSHKDFLTKINPCAKKIKAALLTEEKTIFTDRTLYSAQKRFGQAHELGHHVMPAHNEIFYACSETDLNPITRVKHEFEANRFATELLFPQPLMQAIYENDDLSMETILRLADLSNTTILSSAMRYINGSDKKCCLLIMSIDKDAEGNPGLRLKGQIASHPWEKNYSREMISNFQFFPYNHNLSKGTTSQEIGSVFSTSVKLADANRSFQAQTVFNGFNVFALLL